MEDGAIIRLFFARDERAADECRKKYGGLCFTVAMNVLGDGRDAEECVNDALLSAWESIPPESPRSLSAYLCRISRNLALNRRREASAEKRGGRGSVGARRGDPLAGDGGGRLRDRDDNRGDRAVPVRRIET